MSAARSLGPLALVEGHRLPFTQLIEARALARRIVEEVLVAVLRQNEPETLVADETLDRAVRCHDRPSEKEARSIADLAGYRLINL